MSWQDVCIFCPPHVLFGTGLGTAWLCGARTVAGRPTVIFVTARHVVWADYLFTLPAILFQPLSGLWLAELVGLSTGRAVAACVLRALRHHRRLLDSGGLAADAACANLAGSRRSRRPAATGPLSPLYATSGSSWDGRRFGRDRHLLPDGREARVELNGVASRSMAEAGRVADSIASPAASISIPAIRWTEPSSPMAMATMRGRAIAACWRHRARWPSCATAMARTAPM